uniref:Uncharacterized protein n=1 Tax=Pyramimonas orientalis virus TaxID=455367 RepID=A0A7M3UP25_POV01|nr:hypothetical protein HWQ62_00346 [Pyramimonas orientalis virus]
MNLSKLIADYDSLVKLNNAEKTPVKQKPINGEKTKANKLTDMQLASIMYTNDQYKKKMFKAHHVPKYETFNDKESFNSFIDSGIREMKSTNWKQMPFSFKLPLCKAYIFNDITLNETEKEETILKIDCKNILKAVSYDKELNKIISFDYTQLTQNARVVL